MRYAQIVVGMKGHGKSTYCNVLSTQAETQGRTMKVINMDPLAGVLLYSDRLLGDIREVVSVEQYSEADRTSDLVVGGGFEFVLKHILGDPKWLLGAIGEGGSSSSSEEECDFILYDCPGESEIYAHVPALSEFGDFLVQKGFRVSIIMVQDARVVTDGYSFIASCFTPLISYMSLNFPQINLMMKADLLTEEDKSRLLLFISSDIRDVLRYENNKRGGSDRKLGLVAETATFMLDGYNCVQRKFIVLDIREDQEVLGYLAVLDDILGTPEDDD